MLFTWILQFLIKDKYYIFLYKDYIMYSVISASWDKIFFFWYFIFLLVIIISSLGVLLSKNPIHSIFFLIIVFLHVSFLLLLLHVEFLAFLILIVYLGAIAVLFLFVILLFNIQVLESRDNLIRYLPLVGVIFLILFEMAYLLDWINLKIGVISFKDFFYVWNNWLNIFNNQDNIKVLSLIYTYYFYDLILASLILLVAMIGAIILTLNVNFDLKKQLYFEQNRKNLYNSLILRKNNSQLIEIWKIYYRKNETKKK